MIGLIVNKKIFKNIGFCNLDTVRERFQLVFNEVEKIKSLKNYAYVQILQYEIDLSAKKYTSYIVNEYRVLSEPMVQPELDLDKIKSVNLTTVNKYRVFSLRSNYFVNILLNLHKIKSTIINILNEKQYVSIDSPKIISAGLQTGGSEMFKVKYYDKIVYLTQSPQMYKQILVNVLDRVYEVSTVFRAEKSDSPKHLSEILALDVQLVTNNLLDIIRLLSQIMRKVCKTMGQELDETDFQIYTYEQVSKIINKTELTDFNNQQLFEFMLRTPSKQNWYFITQYPENIRAFYTYGKNSFDLYYKTIQIASGSLRICKYDQVYKKLVSRNMNPLDYEQYLSNFKYGSKPHGGFGLGINRLLMAVSGVTNILDTVAFPRSYTNII